MINPAAIEVVTSVEGVAEMAELDAKLFGPHKALSPDELRLIGEHGLLLAIRDDAGTMVAEAQLITEAIPGAEEPLVRHLPQESGYLEGVAVAPAYNGQGLGLNLVEARRKHLLELGKTDAWATVRTENAPSLTNLFRTGGYVIGYAKDYYPGSDRLVVWQNLLAQQVELNDGSLASVEIQPGDEVDSAANEHIKSLLAAGFVGVGLRRIGEEAMMLFMHLNAEPLAQSAPIIRQKQTFLEQSEITAEAKIT